MGATVYGLHIMLLHFVVLQVFVDSACKQLTMASSQACNLLIISGMIILRQLNWWLCKWLSFAVDETGSCCLLIMLGNGLRCKVFGDEFFSAYSSNDTTVKTKYFRHHFLIIRRRKEKPTDQWHTRDMHIMQKCSCRIFKCMVPVDYSYQWKKK